jgi:hypothetical protein
MRFARLIFAILIAVSVASLPAAGATTLSPKFGELAAAADGQAGEKHDCCPDPETPCSMGCDFMATCTAQGVSFSTAGSFSMVTPSSATHSAALPASDVLPSQTHSPPLHPPQL